MPLWVGGALTALNALLCVRRPRLGFVAYVVLALTMPHVAVLGRSITFEILAIPGVTLAIVAARPKVSHARFHCLVLAYLVLVALSTVVATIKYSVSVEWIRFQGLIRFAVILGLARELLDRDAIRKVIGVVLLVNVAVAGMQLFMPGAAELFFELYGRESQGVLERYAGQGDILRPVGTMESPVRLGALGLFGFAVAYASMLRGATSREDGWLMVLAVFAGMLSATKTFIIGVPLILGSGLLLRWLTMGAGREAQMPRFRPRTGFRMACLALLVVGVATGASVWLQQQQIPIGYYLGFVVNPEGAFATRFGPGGSLSEALEVISENWALGVGMTLPEGEFLGDSGYVSLGHEVGVIGTGFIAGIILTIGYQMVRRNRIFDFVILASIMAIGTGLSWFTTLEGALALTLVVTDRRWKDKYSQSSEL